VLSIRGDFKIGVVTSSHVRLVYLSFSRLVVDTRGGNVFEIFGCVDDDSHVFTTTFGSSFSTLLSCANKILDRVGVISGGFDILDLSVSTLTYLVEGIPTSFEIFGCICASVYLLVQLIFSKILRFPLSMHTNQSVFIFIIPHFIIVIIQHVVVIVIIIQYNFILCRYYRC